MGVASMVPGSEYERVVSFSYVAEWRFKDVVPSTDKEAVPFGPKPWGIRQGLLRATPTPGPQMVWFKPVLYLPVKRSNGTDKPPTLILTIQLKSVQMTRTANVPVWAGTPVDVDVVNVLRGQGAAVGRRRSCPFTARWTRTCRARSRSSRPTSRNGCACRRR